MSETSLILNFPSMTNDLKKEIEKKFITSDKFSQDVEQIVLKQKMNYIDAILHYCEENSVEIESISKLMNKPLKEKLKWDAVRLNFMKKTSKAKLPL
jgi:hypothetical protein